MAILVRAAMSEPDATERAAACERARHEINSRLLELAAQDEASTGDERRNLKKPSGN